MNMTLRAGRLLLVLAFAGSAPADTLVLRSGETLTGKYVGGAVGIINFHTPQGLQQVAVEKAVSLTFSAPVAAAPVATTAPAASPTVSSAPAASAPATGPVTVPAGTTLLVRLDAAISSANASAGQRFSAKLETDLVANGVIAARAGSPVYGRVIKAKKAGRLAGKSELELQLSELNLGGQTLPLVTSNHTQAGDGEFRSTARNAAVGAGVGAAFDGGSGAAKGAVIGGAVSAVKKGEATSLVAGSLLEFRLTTALQITPK